MPEKGRTEMEVGADGVAVITICNPPVNSLSIDVLLSLKESYEEALQRKDVKAIVVTGKGGKFSGGFDISSFGNLHSGEIEQPKVGYISIDIITETLEGATKPSVAAIDGLALGGGLEVAMACHARISTPTAQLGLPELQLGIIPGFGGTQRLPRLVGLTKSLEMMLLSKPVKGEEAHQLGLVDSLVSPNDLVNAARRWALDICELKRPWIKSLYKTDKLESLGEAREILNFARAQARKQAANLEHPLVCIDVIEEGIVSGPRAGLWKEANAFQSLLFSDTCKRLLHVFFSQRATSKVPGATDLGLMPRKITKVAILGGGLMGSGIATAMILSNYPVLLKEVNEKFLNAGIDRIKANLQSRVRKGKMTEERYEKTLSLVTGTLGYEKFKEVDLVIEAVIENVKLKQQIFADLEKYCPSHCILATNTSTIDLNLIGEKTKSQDRIVGAHFFSPAHIMPLLEIVRTQHTSAQVVVDLLDVGKRIKKTPIVVGNCTGFAVNRMFFPYTQSALLFVDYGMDVYKIDHACTKFGMPMGPFRFPTGPRLPSSWNYGAVEKALRESSARGEKCIFQPKEGQVFQTIEEAYEFFNMYSWEVGFGIRYGRSRVDKDKEKSRQDIFCSCQGLDKGDMTRSARCNCPCMLSLLRNDDESWYVKRFCETHNHPMSVSCGEKRRWPSHSRIDGSTKELVRHLRANNVQLSRVCSIVGSVHQSDAYVPFSRQSVRTMCAKLAQESIEGDISKTLEVFARIKNRDPGFVVAMDLDDQKRVRSVLFAHGSSLVDYASFGDVITFDTTYRTNLYNLPFGLFVGVNNHFQSIIFAGVLLTEETIGAFQWTFRNFVAAMGGRAPETILTDQCHQMRVAIESEFPDTRHRWCKWHVLRKAKESLGPVYSKNSSFKRELHELLDQTVCVQEFEEKWADVIARYSLADNDFLTRAFENREMWAKPFFTETFCAGMTSTQRSESANHVLKTYIPRSAPMHLFVTQYDRLVTDRVAEEGREQHATKQVNFLLRAGVPIEKHATKVYTRALFERFFRELFRSGALVCKENGEHHGYDVMYARASSDNEAARRSTSVVCDRKGDVYACACKFFEHSGIPCRHLLKVLVHVGAVEIPHALIKKRWTVNARDGAACPVQGFGEAAARGADAASMHGLLHASAMELVGMGTTSRQAFELAVDYISHAKAALAAMIVADPGQPAFQAQNSTSVGGGVLHFDSGVAAPPRVRSRGRPKELRFKSPIESPGAAKTKTKHAAQAAAKNGENPRRSTRFLKTGVYIVEHCGGCGSTQHRTDACGVPDDEEQATAAPRKCKSCGETGHNRSTCGRKSTYVAK